MNLMVFSCFMFLKSNTFCLSCENLDFEDSFSFLFNMSYLKRSLYLICCIGILKYFGFKSGLNLMVFTVFYYSKENEKNQHI